MGSEVEEGARPTKHSTEEEEAAALPSATDAYAPSSPIHCKMKLPTLDNGIPHSCLDMEKFPLVRANAVKALLKAAKFVVQLTSFVENKLLNQCSGFLIEWGEDNGVGMILTSAKLICCNSPLNEWLGEEKYAPDAKIYVQLGDDKLKCQLLNYHKHYGFALISVPMSRPVELACLSSEVAFAQSVYVLGRDENLNMRISNGRIQFEGPTVYEHHHYMYMDAVVLKSVIGGPVIDIDGKVLGMANLSAHMGFIPSSVLHKCLHLWRKYKCIPRLHLGLKLSPIMFLDPIHIEKISRECNTETGLIIKEVAGGSMAEKLDLRTGDIIISVNGEHITTTVELELMLLRICENCFDKGNGLGSRVDLHFDIFYTSKGSKGIPGNIKLTTNVTDDVEVVSRDTYVSAREGSSALVSDDDADSGDASSETSGD